MLVPGQAGVNVATWGGLADLRRAAQATVAGKVVRRWRAGGAQVARRWPAGGAQVARKTVWIYSFWVKTPADTPPAAPTPRGPAAQPLRRSLPTLAVPVAAPRPASPPEPETLHPALWRAWQLGRTAGPAAGAQASGFAELDAQLPGGGWPARTLTELLLPHPGVGELRLLAPVLGAVQRQGRGVMWFDPPAEPCAWTLAALGLQLRQLVLVRAPAVAHAGVPDTLWALEQALKSGHLGAAVAWLPPRLPADALRRLQLAAQAHDGPVFLLRAEAEARRPSPAPLRLHLASAGADALQLRLLKRRGPPLAQPLQLLLPATLSPAALARAQVPPARQATPPSRQALPAA